MNVLPQKLMVVIWLLSITEAHSSEWFQIERKSLDVFTIPPSQCKGLNYCGRYNAQEYGKNCSCYCLAQSATFAFHQNSWKCVDNHVARDLFGCKKRTFFQTEDISQQLRVVNTESLPKNLLLNGTCSVYLAASWSRRCHRNELSPRETIPPDAFRIRWNAQFSVNRLEFDLSDENPLRGQIINLGINCVGATTVDSCVLFKMEGTTNCSVTGPYTTNAKTTTSTINGKSVNLSTTQVTKASVDVPSSTKDRNSDVVISASIVALIAGINGFLVLVILIIGLCIYHRQQSRNHSPTSIPSGTFDTSVSSLGIRHGQLNPDYATLTPSDCGNYASIYRIPNGVCNDAPRSVEQPVYNIIEVLPAVPKKRSSNYASPEGHQNNVPISVEQRVYNLIEDLPTTAKQGLHGRSSSEAPKNKAPISVEQRVYTFIEDLNTSVAQGPHHNGSSQGHETESPISVEQREYTLIEDLNIKNNENPESSDPEKPAYHVLEGPLTNDARGGSCVRSSDEHERPKE